MPTLSARIDEQHPFQPWRWIIAIMSIALAAMAQFSCASVSDHLPQERCDFAIYRLSSGRLLDIGAADGGDLRWRLDDGRTGLLAMTDHWRSTEGWTGLPDGGTIKVPTCGSDRITFKDPDGREETGSRVPLVIQEGTFESGGVTLFGRLVLPEGPGPFPVVVDVHGAEHDAATDFDFQQRMLPALGVGTFVFDKRGTGRSAGHYTQNFETLADDVVAAAAEARKLAGPRLGSLGLRGASQGGWVAPLAASKMPTDFLIVDFGLAGSPGEENRDQTVLELARRGYGPADLAAAAEVAEAANRVVASHFQSGYDRLDAVRKLYGDRPWFRSLNGQFTGEILSHYDWVLRLFGPSNDVGLAVDYDALQVLQRIDVPMLWVLAGDDTYAPNATTRQRLRQLAGEGKEITALVFPATDHGIVEFTTAPDGKRTNTRYADGFFKTTVDFALHRRLHGAYGDAQALLAPRQEMQQP